MKSILISRCLLGEAVRYDGGHCMISQEQVQKLRRQFTIIPICPELMAGLSVPRNPIEYKDGKIINEQGEDLTHIFDSVFTELDKLIQDHHIQVAILKESSPSCGRHQVYDGSFSGNKVLGQGIVTEYLLKKNIAVYSENEIDELLSN